MSSASGRQTVAVSMERTQPSQLQLLALSYTSTILVILALCCKPTAGGLTNTLGEDENSQPGVYLNKWAVHLDGDGKDAEAVAQAHGFVNRGQVSNKSSYVYLYWPHAALLENICYRGLTQPC